MTTHNKRNGILDNPRSALGRPLWLATSALLWAMLPSCGSRIQEGNAGSETHWLKSCDNDSDCGEYSCYCGVCTKRCDTDSQCEKPRGQAASCVDVDGVSEHDKCGAATPDRICNASVEDTNEGDATSDFTLDSGSTSNSSSTLETNTSSATTTAMDGAVDASAPPTDLLTLCTGNPEVRLVVLSEGGGPLPQDFAFTGRYGWRFLVIDGLCRFWAATAPGKVVTGVATAPDIEPYIEQYYDNLARFADYQPSASCPDAPVTLISDQSGAAQFTCGAIDPPAGWEDTETAALALLQTLADSGERSSGPLRALLRATEVSGDAPTWPLELDPTPVLLTGTPSWEELSEPDAGVLFGEGDSASTLRSATEGYTPYGGYPFAYQTADGPQQLGLLVRDEVPPKVVAALERTRQLVYGVELLGTGCDSNEDCSSSSLQCIEQAGPGGETACSTCLQPNDPGICHSNDDCCAGFVCCLDCGEMSGSCIIDEAPCTACIDNGSNWTPSSRTCAECSDDSVECFTDECPGSCSDDNCQGCGQLGDCWAAGCSWDESGSVPHCVATPAAP